MAGNINILVVEDDPDIREVILMVLSMEGWNVTGLYNGHNALISI